MVRVRFSVRQNGQILQRTITVPDADAQFMSMHDHFIGTDITGDAEIVTKANGLAQITVVGSETTFDAVWEFVT